ncbi:MAG TPA: hypothetical protein VI756_21345, partial [Blastocatellia bacterium]
MRTNPLFAFRHLLIVLAVFVGLTYCLSIPGSSAGSGPAFPTPETSAGAKTATVPAADSPDGTVSAGEDVAAWKGLSLGFPFVGVLPASPPVGATVTATKSHSPTGPFHLGDTITYTVVVSDSGSNATGLTVNDSPDPNTTLVAGSVAASPVAVADSYTATGNVEISVPAASGVLANDFLGLNPAATITAFDATSANGGTVSMTTSGGNA